MLKASWCCGLGALPKRFVKESWSEVRQKNFYMLAEVSQEVKETFMCCRAGKPWMCLLSHRCCCAPPKRITEWSASFKWGSCRGLGCPTPRLCPIGTSILLLNFSVSLVHMIWVKLQHVTQLSTARTIPRMTLFKCLRMGKRFKPIKTRFESRVT